MSAPTPAPADALALDYEALRAQATGAPPRRAPRGLALLLAGGLPGWMQVWAPLQTVAPPAAPRTSGPPTGLAPEVVRLLTEMALSGRWATR